MKEITEYEIISEFTTDDMQYGVAQEIRNGWQPLGGVSLTTYATSRGLETKYAQAMVKYAP